jgi:3-hydroxyacyl-[acyl-carrier-protein] dehydratase
MAQASARLPLPHAYPFLLVDRVLELRPGSSAAAVKNLTRDDPLLDADGQLPPVLLVEALAQVAGLAVLGVRPGAGAVLVRVDRFRCRLPLIAGDALHVSVQVCRIFGAAAKVRGVVRVNGRVRAAAEVVLQVTAPEPAGAALGDEG